MNTKSFGFLLVLLVISLVPAASAQISIGEKATHKSVEIVISSVGDVHIKHVVDASKSPRQVELIKGTVSNLLVTDEQGEEKQFAVVGENSGVLVLPSETDSVVEYDLEDGISQIDKVWTWNFRYLESTTFLFPDQVDLIFSNERPVYLDENKGIVCHGCQMILEYSITEPTIVENVKWEDREFAVEIKSHSATDNFVFDQPAKRITFDVSDKDRYVTAIIPLELLWQPYAVFLDDEKIFFHEYINNGTHVWLNVKPDTAGQVTIIGTTVIPEFSIIVPLMMMGFLMILAMPMIRKFSLR